MIAYDCNFVQILRHSCNAHQQQKQGSSIRAGYSQDPKWFLPGQRHRLRNQT